LRGIGEGQRPWDVKPDGVMTNATVGNVIQSTEGGVVHVTYKDGQSEFARTCAISWRGSVRRSRISTSGARPA